jgi:branched-chain amino acid transport system substrate-binding protein
MKRINHKSSAVFILFSIIITSLMVFSIGCVKKEGKEIKIGTVLPLTGSAAVWGENSKMGLEIALEEVNAAGGVKGKKINLIFEDSQSDSAKAVSALQKLISTDKVSVVIGDIASSSVLAMAPIAEKAKVILLSPGASNPDISKAGEYIFRNWQSDALEGEVDAKYAYEHLGWKNMATLYVSNAYGTGLKKVFEESFQKLGGKILASESFEQGATDMRAQLNKIRNLKIDAIYMPGYPPEMAILLRQAKEMGIKISFLSVQAFDDPKILETAKGAAEGVIFSVPKPPDPSNSIVKNFIDKYTQKFNREPGVTSDTGYDALKIIVWAMNQAGTSSEEVRRQLLTMKDFPGAAGLTTFDKNGDVIKPFIFKEVKGGKFENIKF